MKHLLCIFRPCVWFHVKDGIWQCYRCKTISMGKVLPNDSYMNNCPQ